MSSRERSLAALWNDPDQDEVLFVLQVVPDEGSQTQEQGNTYIPAVILSPNTCKVINSYLPSVNFNPLRYEQEDIKLIPLEAGKGGITLVLHHSLEFSRQLDFLLMSDLSNTAAKMETMYLEKRGGSLNYRIKIAEDNCHFGTIPIAVDDFTRESLDLYRSAFLKEALSKGYIQLPRYVFRVNKENGIEIRDPNTEEYFPLYERDQNGRYRISEKFRAGDLRNREAIEAKRYARKSENDEYKKSKNRKLDTMRNFFDDAAKMKFKDFMSKVQNLEPVAKIEDMSFEERNKLKQDSIDYERLRTFAEQIRELHEFLSASDSKALALAEQIEEGKNFLIGKFNLLKVDEIIYDAPRLYEKLVNRINGSNVTTVEKFEQLMRLKEDIELTISIIEALNLQEDELKLMTTFQSKMEVLIKDKINVEIEKLREKVIAPLEFYSNAVKETALIKAVIYLKIRMGIPLCDLTCREKEVVKQYPRLENADLLSSLEQADRIVLKKLIDRDPGGLLPFLNQTDKHVPGFMDALCQADLLALPLMSSSSSSSSLSTPSLRFLSSSSSSLPTPISKSDSQTGRMAQIDAYTKHFHEIMGSGATVFQKLQQLIQLKEDVRPFVPNGIDQEEYEAQAKKLMGSIEEIDAIREMGSKREIKSIKEIGSIREAIAEFQEKFKEQVIMKLENYLEKLTADENEKNVVRKILIHFKSMAYISLIDVSAEENRLIIQYPRLLKANGLLFFSGETDTLDKIDKKSLENDELLDFLISFTVKVPEFCEVLFNQIIFSSASDLQKLQRLNKLSSHISPFENFDDNLKKLVNSITLTIKGYREKLNAKAVISLEKFLTDLESDYNEKTKVTFLGWLRARPILPGERNMAEINSIKTLVRKIILCLKLCVEALKIELSEAERELKQKEPNLNMDELYVFLTAPEKSALQNPELQKILKSMAPGVPQLQSILSDASQNEYKK